MSAPMERIMKLERDTKNTVRNITKINHRLLKKIPISIISKDFRIIFARTYKNIKGGLGGRKVKTP